MAPHELHVVTLSASEHLRYFIPCTLQREMAPAVGMLPLYSALVDENTPWSSLVLSHLYLQLYVRPMVMSHLALTAYRAEAPPSLLLAWGACDRAEASLGHLTQMDDLCGTSPLLSSVDRMDGAGLGDPLVPPQAFDPVVLVEELVSLCLWKSPEAS